MGRVIRSSGARWSASQTSGATFVPPLFNASFEQTTSIDDGPTLSPLIMRDDGPANTAHPLYIQKCGTFNGSIPALTRPATWEPDLYHGKPFTIVRRPKAVIIYHPLDNGGIGGGPGSLLPFDQTAFYAELDVIAATTKAMGVHMYASPFPDHGSWLLWGMPMGGYEAGFWGDVCSLATAPSSYPYGELLVLVFSQDPAGWGAQVSSATDGSWNAMTSTLITTRCGALDTFGPLLAETYYGFAGAASIDQPDLLDNDRTIAMDYIVNFDRFRQVMHPYDDAAITKLYQDIVTPQPTPPAGYPGTATDVWNAVTAGIPEYTVGGDINPIGTYADMAAVLLASIQDFYS